VNRVNARHDERATLYFMSIFATVGLMVLTLGAAYALWSLLLRAEQLYTQLEDHGQTAADVAGIAFLALAAVIVFGASAALLFETHRLISALFF
jgi:multisubunit Na+/H+ antiporter MnhG subunit